MEHARLLEGFGREAIVAVAARVAAGEQAPELPYWQLVGYLYCLRQGSLLGSFVAWMKVQRIKK